MSLYLKLCIIRQGIRELAIGSCQLGPEGAQHLSRALQHNTALVELDMWNNDFGDEGVQYISDGLQYNSVIFITNLSI